MSLVLVNQPGVEPVSLTEAKLHLRVDGTDEDALINSLIKTARMQVESITNCVMITQTWRYKLDEWPSRNTICIPKPPLQSVSTVTYTDREGETSTFESTNYLTCTDPNPGEIVLKNDSAWPSGALLEKGGITILFTAGFGNAGSDVPEPIRQAMQLLIGHLYENREAVSVATGANIKELPMGFMSLLANYRHRRF